MLVYSDTLWSFNFFLLTCSCNVESTYLWELGALFLRRGEGVTFLAFVESLELLKGTETSTWNIYMTKTCTYLLHVIHAYFQQPRFTSGMTDDLSHREANNHEGTQNQV